jgi:hypothetical protein
MGAAARVPDYLTHNWFVFGMRVLGMFCANALWLAMLAHVASSQRSWGEKTALIGLVGSGFVFAAVMYYVIVYRDAATHPPETQAGGEDGSAWPILILIGSFVVGGAIVLAILVRAVWAGGDVAQNYFGAIFLLFFGLVSGLVVTSYLTRGKKDDGSFFGFG